MTAQTHQSAIVSEGRPTVDFDHLDPSYRTEWRQRAAEFHAKGTPVAWSPHHGGFWVVSSWEAVKQIGDDWETFTSVNDLDGTENGGRGQMIPPNQYRLFLGESDPPLHTGRRGLEAPFFAPRSLRKWRPAAIEFLNEAIDKVLADGRADLIDDVIVPTAARTTLFVLGYDPDDWQDAAAAARRSIYLLPSEEGFPIAELERMRARFRSMLVERHDDPRDDLITRLATGLVEGEPLGLDEGESMMNALVFGGFDTTVALVAQALIFLQHNPDLADRFRDEPELRRNAVEELLRVFPPGAGMGRTAVRDTVLAGQSIAKGERVFMWLGAANLDPTVFPNPDAVDFERTNARDHVSFSVGVHRCLGSPLAKMEALEMLEIIPQRLSGLQILDDEVQPYPKGLVAGFIRVPATFAKADPGASSVVAPTTGQEA